MDPTDATPGLLLARARAGDDEAVGRLLELYRNYLRLLARSLIGGTLRIRLDPSDLVQEAFLKAHRQFGRFAGQGEPELVSWLRQILIRTLADQVKHHQRQARNFRRQESLEVILDRSGQEAERVLATYSGSPSSAAARREQAVLLSDALARLPDDYREVFILRTLEQVPLEQVAARMGRSPGAVRMLWTRAVERLSRLLEDQS